MRMRLPLFARILLWFFLNLVIILLVLLSLFKLQFHAGRDSPLAGMIGNRLQEVGTGIRDELERADTASWDAILARHGATHDVSFVLVSRSGDRIAGESLSLPGEILARLQGRNEARDTFLPPPLPDVPPGQPGEPPPPGLAGRAPWDAPRLPGSPRGPSPDRDRGPPPDRAPPPLPGLQSSVPMDLAIHTTDPSRYWAGIHLPLFVDGESRPRRTVLLAVSGSLTGNGLFFDVTPWILVLSVIVGLSFLVWLPLVRSITRPIRQASRAASQIALGRFDIRLDERRGDEIGALASAINDMSRRLDLLVNGQKRFLGDVAHELASPIARIQLALGILENALGDDDQVRLEDLREEVQQLAELVNELLSFSRAESNLGKGRLEPVAVATIVQRAIRRENTIGADIGVFLEPGLTALADPELLARALANLLRNAIRYAGSSGPIEVVGRTDGEDVRLEIRDHGPGVPEEHLARIFEPFYRVDGSRTRECGGVGLGLAIVKTCVAACRGTVTAINRSPTGLSVEILLVRAGAPSAPTD